MDPKDKWFALFTIQLVGVLLALLGARKLDTFTNIKLDKLTQVQGVLWGVLIFTVCLMVLKAFPSILGMTLNEDDTALVSLLPFEIAISLCALVDLFGLAKLIKETGGSRQTIYTPYLFTIVLLIIMLNAPKITIFICFVLTVIIFYGCLLWSRLYNSSFEVTKPKLYNRHYGAIIGVCVLFPTLLKVYEECF